MKRRKEEFNTNINPEKEIETRVSIHYMIEFTILFNLSFKLQGQLLYQWIIAELSVIYSYCSM